MIFLKLASLALCMLNLAAAYPADLISPELETPRTIEDVVDDDDSPSFGSYIRETRAAPSNDGEYYKSDEREGNGEIGYSRKKSGGGKKGYQHFDSYHKKAGDNYEFEKQDSFGHDDEGQDGAYSHRNERRAEREHEGEHERERLREPEEFEDEHGEEADSPRKKPKQRKDKQHAELREGAADGNGGVEAVGHDPNDYILPEKYTYGKEAEEYNF